MSKPTKTSKKKNRTSQYKWIKHLYAEVDEIKEDVKENRKRIEELEE